jgi:glutamate/tyrosine decarboxylase-like PLP-dependent enzyme
LQRALIHVAEDVVIDFNDGRQRALAKAGDSPDGAFSIGGSQRQLIGVVAIRQNLTAKSQVEAHLFQQIA